MTKDKARNVGREKIMQRINMLLVPHRIKSDLTQEGQVNLEPP